MNRIKRRRQRADRGVESPVPAQATEEFDEKGGVDAQIEAHIRHLQSRDKMARIEGCLVGGGSRGRPDSRGGFGLGRCWLGGVPVRRCCCHELNGARHCRCRGCRGGYIASIAASTGRTSTAVRWWAHRNYLPSEDGVYPFLWLAAGIAAAARRHPGHDLKWSRTTW